MDIDEMIGQLLDMELSGEDGRITFSKEAEGLIHRIAEKCSTIPIVKETQEQAEAYAQGLSAEQIYIDMLEKIVQAPTRIHMRIVARMLIPIINRKLKEGGTNG